jgi:hypothetical protein
MTLYVVHYEITFSDTNLEIHRFTIFPHKIINYNIFIKDKRYIYQSVIFAAEAAVVETYVEKWIFP